MEEDIKLLEKFVNTNSGALKIWQISDISECENLRQAIENLINKYKKQEKIIELMAKDIAENKLNEDICRQIKDPKKEECYAYQYNENACSDCVIEYYEKKAKGE